MRIRFARFTVASAIATGITQLVLVGVYSLGTVDALTASSLAFLAGAVPHFLLVRYWAWRASEPSRLSQQLTGYLVVTLVGGVASIGLTTLTEPMLTALDQDWQALLLAAAYLVAGIPVFLVKFAVFDRLFARAAQPAYAATSSTRVRAPNPVAPLVTSS